MPHIVISLDGGIGAGKSTLLEEIRKRIPEINVVEEPVNQWTYLVNEHGENMLELFYADKKRWGYTFQTCALLTRQKSMQAMINRLSGSQFILTERSILTDKHIFAEMLYRTGDLSLLEWDMYNMLFDTISQQHTVHAIIYLSTNSTTCKERIALRGRPEEENISLPYLDDLDKQHKTWLEHPGVPVLTLSAEQGSSIDTAIQQINDFMEELKVMYL